ncbi:MAG: hypothetical protein KY475_05320, partial [Planctomycetes bacterium]|nr:hypothetical protein [Planctomycetota bacterium]
MRIRPRTYAWLLILAVAGASATAVGQESARLSHQQRRARLEKMSAAEKEQLLRQKERFDQLSPQEQEELRATCKALAEAPDGDQLFGILQHYCDWLKSLPPVERAEVLALPPEQRIAKIKKLVKEQEEQRIRKLANLSYEEGKAVKQWFADRIKPHQDELWALLPRDSQRWIESRADDADQRRRMMLWGLLWNRHGAELRERIMPDPGEVEGLLGLLSEERREEFKKLRDSQQQTDLLESWLRASVFASRFRVSEETLLEFVDELPREEQTRLEMMPREDMQRELQRLYLQRFSRPGWGRDGGPPRGKFGDGFRRRHDDGDDRRHHDHGRDD